MVFLEKCSEIQCKLIAENCHRCLVSTTGMLVVPLSRPTWKQRSLNNPTGDQRKPVVSPAMRENL